MEELSNYYLISGIFFEPRSPFTTPGLKIRSNIGEYIYTGALIWDEHSAMTMYRGIMIDPLGSANLTDVRILPHRLTFRKKYASGRPHNKLIEYDFVQRRTFWEGTYSLDGRDGGRLVGPSRCILTPVTEEFFEYDFLELFKRTATA
jgi:hypothetical protein